LATGQLKDGSTFLEADSDFQHIGTAIRYFIDFEYPLINNKPQFAQITGI